MASNTCSIKPIKRSAGRSATAAAAYRAGAEIVDQRTGEVHDYTRKGGVVSAEIVAPDHAPTWAHDREALWNAAEFSETRKNARVAREFLVGLPHELDDEQRQQLAREFAQSLVDRYGFAVDVCLHEPDKGGDQRNHHAHILATTRRMGPEGLAEKTRELDDKTSGPLETRWVRQQFQELTNEHLERAGADERIDMRSYKDQGLDFEPTQHMGPAASGMERRKRGSTQIGRENQERQERNLVREFMTQDIEEDQIYVDRLEAESEYIEIERERLEVEIKAKKDLERFDRVMNRVQERIRPQMQRLAELMDEWGVPGADRLRDRLRSPEKAQNAPEPIGQADARLDRLKATDEAVRSQRKPEQGPLDFLDDDDDDDPNIGPRPG